MSVAQVVLTVPMLAAIAIAVLESSVPAALIALVLVGFAAAVFTFLGALRLGRVPAGVAALTSAACARAAFITVEPESGVLHVCTAGVSLVLAAVIIRG